jgi:hypothetical protein
MNATHQSSLEATAPIPLLSTADALGDFGLMNSGNADDVRVQWDASIDQLLKARSLSDDYDGQGAKAPPIELVDLAIRLAQQLRREGCLPPDDCGASVSGTIVLAWYREQASVEIEIDHHHRIEGHMWARGDREADRFLLALPD